MARPFIEKWLIEDADAVTPIPEIRAIAETWLGGMAMMGDARIDAIMEGVKARWSYGRKQLSGFQTRGLIELIGNGIRALLENADQPSRLRDDPALIKSGIEELLRHSGPLETALSSPLPTEQQFEHADGLDLGREPNPYVAFGQGVHYCLGAPLASLEGQIAISTLLRRMPDLKLATPLNGLRWRRGLVLRGLEALPVEFSKQN